MVSKMDRLGTSIDDLVAFRALVYRAQNAADDALEADPLDRTDRADVVPGSYLKAGDDVTVSGVTCRVGCAARGQGWFMGWSFVSDDGEHWQPYEAAQVTDRAPADPEEEPMPIFPEP